MRYHLYAFQIKLPDAMLLTGLPLVIKSLKKCLNFAHSNSRPLKGLEMKLRSQSMVLKSPWKVLRFCYRIFELFWKSVQAGFYSGPFLVHTLVGLYYYQRNIITEGLYLLVTNYDCVAFGEYDDISCMHVL